MLNNESFIEEKNTITQLYFDGTDALYSKHLTNKRFPQTLKLTTSTLGKPLTQLKLIYLVFHKLTQ